MKEEGIKFGSFRDWSENRYENFIVGGKLMTADQVQARLNSRSFWDRQTRRKAEEMVVSGYRAYSTPSGKLVNEEIWWNQNWETGKTQEVNWGPEVGYGTKQMNGNVWKWMMDKYGKVNRRLRGGSWYNILPDGVRVACRDNNPPDERGCGIGIGLAAALQDSSVV